MDETRFTTRILEKGYVWEVAQFHEDPSGDKDMVEVPAFVVVEMAIEGELSRFIDRILIEAGEIEVETKRREFVREALNELFGGEVGKEIFRSSPFLALYTLNMYTFSVVGLKKDGEGRWVITLALITRLVFEEDEFRFKKPRRGNIYLKGKLAKPRTLQGIAKHLDKADILIMPLPENDLCAVMKLDLLEELASSKKNRKKVFCKFEGKL